MNSERSRIRVIGVRRSWLIAASILVRSSIRAVIRSRIRLSALATERISSGPRSGSGAAAPFRLKFSAALANDDSGAVRARAAHRPSRVTLIDGKQQRHHPRSAPERTLPLVPQQLGRNHRAVRQHDADLVAVVVVRRAKRSGSCCRGGGAGRAARDCPSSLAAADSVRRTGFRSPVAERPARCRQAAAAVRSRAPRRAAATAAASWLCPRSIDGSSWSGRWIRKVAVMIR